jgi:hypothetical protein
MREFPPMAIKAVRSITQSICSGDAGKIFAKQQPYTEEKGRRTSEIVERAKEKAKRRGVHAAMNARRMEKSGSALC